MQEIKVSNDLQDLYDHQYDNKIKKWRELGGKYKAQNIIEVSNGKSYNKVLEYGAGEGSILSFLETYEPIKELYAVEISNSGVEQIKSRNLNKLKVIKKFDGYNTDYKDNEFDLVYCSHVIEHAEYPRLLLREIKRISKTQVFEVPLDYSKNVDSKMEHYLSYGHINIYTPSLFRFLLKSEGFEVLNDLHTTLARELIEYSWYENMNYKKSIYRSFLSYILSNKSNISKLILGKNIAQEYFYSAYTCLTKKI